MVNGIPDDRPDGVLRGVLAHVLAPPLDLRPEADHPHPLACLMQITHKNHFLSRKATLKSIAGTCIEPSRQKALSTSTLRILRK